MTLHPKERALLKVCAALTVAACLLAALCGAGQVAIMATAYACLAGTGAIWAYERNRPTPTLAPRQAPPAPSPAPPSIRVRSAEPTPSSRPRLTRSLLGILLAIFLMVLALAPVARPYSGGLVLSAMGLWTVAGWGRLSERDEDEEELELTLSATLRCPFCREAFTRDEQVSACEGCQTVYHAECLAEWSRCAVLGCAPQPSFGPPSRVRLSGAREAA